MPYALNQHNFKTHLFLELEYEMDYIADERTDDHLT